MLSCRFGIGDMTRSTMKACGRVDREGVCSVIGGLGGAAYCPSQQTQADFAGLPLSGLCHDSGRPGPDAANVPASTRCGCHMGDGESRQRSDRPNMRSRRIELPPTVYKTTTNILLVVRLCEHPAKLTKGLPGLHDWRQGGMNGTGNLKLGYQKTTCALISSAILNRGKSKQQ